MGDWQAGNGVFSSFGGYFLRRRGRVESSQFNNDMMMWNSTMWSIVGAAGGKIAALHGLLPLRPKIKHLCISGHPAFFFARQFGFEKGQLGIRKIFHPSAKYRWISLRNTGTQDVASVQFGREVSALQEGLEVRDGLIHHHVRYAWKSGKPSGNPWCS